MGAINSTSNSSELFFDFGFGDTDQYETVYAYPEDSAFWIILLSFIIGLATFAVVSNLLFLITVIRDSALRKTRLSVFLVDMAVIDILTSVGYIILAGFKIEALNPRFTGWLYLNAFFTLFVSIARNAFQFLSSVLIICIAWERYKAVCRPFETMASSRHLKMHTAIVLFGTIILFVLFVAGAYVSWLNFAPISLEFSSYCDDIIENGIRTCYTRRYLVFHGVPLMNYVLIAVDFFTLVISMTVFCIIIRKIKHSPALGAANRHQKEERKLTRMAFVNNVAFVVLVLLQDLSTILVIAFATLSFPKSGEFVYNIQGIWNLLNSAANPIIYNIFGTRYRQAMMKTFRMCIKRPMQRKQGTSDTCTTTDTCTDGDTKPESSTFSFSEVQNVKTSAF